MKYDTAIAYPFPMHLSQGFTYHLSILQFTIALSRKLPVFLICLDTRLQIETIVESQFGEKLPDNFKVLTAVNRRFGFKSNTLWFRAEVWAIIQNLARESNLLAIYTRNVKIASAVFSNKARLPKNVIRIFESHQLFSQNLSFVFEFKRARREYLLERRLYANCDLIFVNTSLLQMQIKRAFQKDSIVLPLAVRSDDLIDFRMLNDSNYGVRDYDFVYAGSFDEWKGVAVFIEALAVIVDKGWKGRAALIGVTEKDLPVWKLRLSDLGIAQQVDLRLKASKKYVKDILDQSWVGVVPNSLLDDSLWSTSPLKLFDYAARGLRLLVSRVPAIYADIDPPDIFWFKPDNPSDMAIALIAAVKSSQEPSFGNYDWASQHTWDKRADRVLELIKATSNA